MTDKLVLYVTVKTHTSSSFFKNVSECYPGPNLIMVIWLGKSSCSETPNICL